MFFGEAMYSRHARGINLNKKHSGLSRRPSFATCFGVIYLSRSIESFCEEIVEEYIGIHLAHIYGGE